MSDPEWTVVGPITPKFGFMFDKDDKCIGVIEFEEQNMGKRGPKPKSKTPPNMETKLYLVWMYITEQKQGYIPALVGSWPAVLKVQEDMGKLGVITRAGAWDSRFNNSYVFNVNDSLVDVEDENVDLSRFVEIIH